MDLEEYDRTIHRKWTEQQQRGKYKELAELYVHQNKTIFEIAALLHVHPGGVYDRLVRLGIPTGPKRHEKPSHNARMLHVPSLCGDLAEFCGVMLGDGHIGPSQIWITVNVKTDAPYIPYLQALQEHLFQFRPRGDAREKRLVSRPLHQFNRARTRDSCIRHC